MSNWLWGVTVCSTIAWALFDAIRKRLVISVPIGALSFWVSAAQLPFYFGWVLWTGASSPKLPYWPPALASILVNLVANLLFLAALKRTPLSTAIPLLAFTPVFVALVGGPLLGERLGSWQWLGVAMVSAGALAQSVRPGASSKLQSSLKAFASERGVHYMLAVAALWALAPLCDKLAMRHVSAGVHGFVLSAGVAMGMLLVLLLRRELRSLPLSRKTARLVLWGGLVNVFALGLQLVAIAGMVVSLFEAFKRAAGLLLAMLVGRVYFGERLSLAAYLAAAVMAAGVSLVVLLS